MRELDTAFEIFTFPIAKAFSAIILLRQFPTLDHRSHCAVENNNAFAQEPFERMQFSRHVRAELSGVYAKDQETNLRIMICRCVYPPVRAPTLTRARK